MIASGTIGIGHQIIVERVLARRIEVTGGLGFLGLGAAGGKQGEQQGKCDKGLAYQDNSG